MPNLSGFPVLDVAIGLVVLFFLLATVCSSINEMIATVLGWRSKTLEDALRSMFNDPHVKRQGKEYLGRVTDRAKQDFTTDVLTHWRIQGLVRDPGSTLRRRSRPSYLPPRALSLAVAERLAGGPEGTLPDGKSVWAATDDEILAHVQAGIKDLPGEQARQLLDKAAVNAHGHLEGFRLQVETAFDDAMQRASGWYKRKVQIFLVGLAVLIALGGNVSTVRVADRLWNDERGARRGGVQGNV